MKIGMTVTLSGLIRALRWTGLGATDTRPSKPFEPVGKPAARVVERVRTRRQKDGL